MQLQIGKKRRALEEAFDHRTAELRVLSERESQKVPWVRSNTDGIQRLLSVFSGVNQTVRPHSRTQRGACIPRSA